MESYAPLALYEAYIADVYQLGTRGLTNLISEYSKIYLTEEETYEPSKLYFKNRIHNILISRNNLIISCYSIHNQEVIIIFHLLNNKKWFLTILITGTLNKCKILKFTTFTFWQWMVHWRPQVSITGNTTLNWIFLLILNYCIKAFIFPLTR